MWSASSCVAMCADGYVEFLPAWLTNPAGDHRWHCGHHLRTANWAPSPSSTAAAPETFTALMVDTHQPGHNELKHYWLFGEGRSRWTTWTELYNHLVKYLNPELAKRVTESWYKEATGMAGGSDANRVAHGHPPRGKKIGPG